MKPCGGAIRRWCYLLNPNGRANYLEVGSSNYMAVSENRGNTPPKWDGENNGKPSFFDG